ncbi:MAG: hypothetical protein ACRC5T_09940 [Cetobacterium sp.]
MEEMKEKQNKTTEENKNMLPLIIAILIVFFAIYLKVSISSTLEGAAKMAYSGAYDLSTVQSVGGNTIAEAFYQGMGEYYKGQYKILIEIGNGIGNLIVVVSLVGFTNTLFQHLNLKKS